MMNEPKLSICIPTFNRAAFLDTLLKFLIESPPVDCDVELIVCDNHSTDDTEQVVQKWAALHPRLIYRRQAANMGAVNNLLTVYRLARGEYALYLADDDRLTPGAVDEVLKFMDDQPQIVAAHAPWEVWWVLDEGPVNVFYRIDEDQVFSQSTAPQLFNLIIANHIFPEICVYRTAAMQRMMAAPSRGYFAFTHLADILDYGDVAFLKRPYYRHTVAHPGFPPRQLAGATSVFSDRDSFEGGLEYLGHRCLQLAHGGSGAVPDAQRAVVGEMVRTFMDACLESAITQLMDHQNDFEGAFELLVRLAARGKLSPERIARLNNDLPPQAVAQEFARIFAGMSLLDRASLAGVEDPEGMISRIRRHRPELMISVMPPGEPPPADHAESTLVLAGAAADRARLVAAGYLPGLIVSEADLDRRLRL